MPRSRSPVPAHRSMPVSTPLPPPSRPGPVRGETCPSCHSGRLTTLVMTLTDGTPVTFYSCRNCEHRVWSHEGSALELADVLSRATKPRP
jgi:hypothetical protein